MLRTVVWCDWIALVTRNLSTVSTKRIPKNKCVGERWKSYVICYLQCYGTLMDR